MTTKEKLDAIAKKLATDKVEKVAVETRKGVVG